MFNLQDESVYDLVFQMIAHDIQEGIAKGKAYDMQFLLARFKAALREKGVETADSYRSEKLKRRLQNYFGNSLVFHKLLKPHLVNQ